MKILVTGYYGAGNFGDDVMLETFINNMYEKDRNIKIDVLKLFEKSLEIKLISNSKIHDMSRLPGIIRTTYFKILSAQYDLFLWVGGTCFTDSDGDGLYPYMSIAKCKIGYIGVGVGNLTVKERIEKTKILTEKSSIMSFRDEKSYSYCCEINEGNKYLAEDLAYLHFKNIYKNPIKMEKELLISWRNLIGYCEEEKEVKLMDELVMGVKEIVKCGEYEKITILPLDDRKDKEKNYYIFERLKETIECIEIVYLDNLTPKEKVDVLRRVKLNISGRLHGIFFSELLNIKTIALSYSNKIDYFLDNIGKSLDCIDVKELNKDILLDKFNNGEKKVKDETIENNIKKSELNIEKLLEFSKSFK